jgi:hypothetical protein
MNDADEPGSRVALGFVLGLLLQVLSLPLAVVLSAIGGNEDFAWESVYEFIGAAQLAYMVPAIGIAVARGHRRLAKGLLLAAAIVALLNGACWGLVKAFIRV